MYYILSRILWVLASCSPCALLKHSFIPKFRHNLGLFANLDVVGRLVTVDKSRYGECFRFVATAHATKQDRERWSYSSDAIELHNRIASDSLIRALASIHLLVITHRKSTNQQVQHADHYILNRPRYKKLQRPPRNIFL